MDSEFERIKKVIAEFFVEREGAGILDVIYDINFVDEGIIDSLDIISLAAYIEKNLGRKVDLTGGDALNAVGRFDSLVNLVFHAMKIRGQT